MANKIKMLFSGDEIESIAAFLTGGIPAFLISLKMMNELLLPMFLAGLTGLIGGAFALLGKDLYKWVKSKLINNDGI
jgi:hypothetical protein